MDAFETTVPLSLTDADRAVRDALASEGFGVLTEIDVAATLKAKLGVVRPPLVILGACNPAFANRALELDPSAALVLPCNVTLEPAAVLADLIAQVRALDMDDVRAALAEPVSR